MERLASKIIVAEMEKQKHRQYEKYHMYQSTCPDGPIMSYKLWFCR